MELAFGKDLIAILIVNGFDTYSEVNLNPQIEELKKQMYILYPNLKFEIIIYRIPVKVNGTIFYNKDMPQLGSLINDIPEIIVFERPNYNKLCNGMSLQYNEFKLFGSRVICDDIEYPTYFRLLKMNNIFSTENIIKWIKNNFNSDKVRNEDKLELLQDCITKIKFLPEVLVYIHHPCNNIHCIRALDIFKEVITSLHIDTYIYICTEYNIINQFPNFVAPSYPCLIAMSKENHQKLKEGKEINLNEIEIFRHTLNNGRFEVIQTMWFSAPNLRKWMGIEKLKI